MNIDTDNFKKSLMAMKAFGDEKKELGEDSYGREVAGHRHGFFTYMWDCMGGFESLVRMAEVSARAAKSMFKENKPYQKTIGLLNSALPLSLTAIEFGRRINSFIVSKVRDSRPYIDEEKFILYYLLEKEDNISDNPEDSWHRVSSCHLYIQRNMIDWITSRPQTDIFKSRGVLNEKFEKVDKVDYSSSWTNYFLMCMDDKEFAIKIQYDHIFGECRYTQFFHTGDLHEHMIMGLLNIGYISSLNYKENLIVFEGSTSSGPIIKTYPRRNVDHEVYQLNEKFFKELKNSVKKKKKRGYAIVGRPGVGKTTIIDKIVDKVRDIPAFVVTADSSKTARDIMVSLAICQTVSPCIVVFEDIDMLPMRDKDSKHLCAFIEYLDSQKFKKPMIFIATLNEPENIHPSLMDRRGRFDKVIVIDPPSEMNHVIDVMSNVYARECDAKFPTNIVTSELFTMITQNSLCHSDFAEVVNCMLINDVEFTSENLFEAFKEICDTQSLVDKFKVRGDKMKKINLGDLRLLAGRFDSKEIVNLYERGVVDKVIKEILCEEEYGDEEIRDEEIRDEETRDSDCTVCEF